MLAQIARMGVAMLIVSGLALVLDLVFPSWVAGWVAFGAGVVLASALLARKPTGEFYLPWPGQHLVDTSRGAYIEDPRSDPGRGSVVRHLDALPWHVATPPRRFHQCWAQTTGWVDGLPVERCACGAFRPGYGSWRDRNSRLVDASPSR